MRYIADTVDFELEEPTVVTLGKFDGRHRGHQKLLHTMEEVKESLGYATAIFTFSTAPLTLVTGETATVITTSEERRIIWKKWELIILWNILLQMMCGKWIRLYL